MLNKLINVVKRDGFRYSAVRIIARLLRVEIGIQRAKSKAWAIIQAKHDYTVGYGIFKGMKLNKTVWWSKNDQVTQLLGSYEEHIQHKLEYFAHKGPKAFVDIGAADGYFAVGAIVSGIFERVYAFEIEHSGRDSIRENSILNNCEDVIKVFGEADYESINEILHMEDTVVVLIDIEGAEYQFLDSKMLELLKGHYVICELHPWLVEGGEKQQTKLLNRVKNAFSFELIKREAYRPNHYKELNPLSDEERLVAIGEERAQNMQWLVLTPK